MIPPVDPILLKIGNTPIIHWYGLLIVTGIILGANIAAYLAKRASHDPEKIWDMLFIVITLAIVGARLYHVVSSPAGGQLGWAYYLENPLKIFVIWEGGLGIYGAIVGGALGILLFCRYHKLNPLEWMDFSAPGVAIGQSIGRWGNFINRELYGPPTTLPWGLDIPVAYRIDPYRDLVQYSESTRFHPTFLYESLATLILCLVLLWVADKYQDRRKPGDLLVGYLVGYAVIRFFTEFLRPDAWMMGSLAAAQIIALILFVAGVIFLVTRHWLGRKVKETS